jgi:hypothetical protein
VAADPGGSHGGQPVAGGWPGRCRDRRGSPGPPGEPAGPFWQNLSRIQHGQTRRPMQITHSGAATTGTLAIQVADHIGGSVRVSREQDKSQKVTLSLAAKHARSPTLRVLRSRRMDRAARTECPVLGSSGRWPAHRGWSRICPLHRGPGLGRRDRPGHRRYAEDHVGPYRLSAADCRGSDRVGADGHHLVEFLRAAINKPLLRMCCHPSIVCPAPDEPACRAELIARLAPRLRVHSGGKVAWDHD